MENAAVSSYRACIVSQPEVARRYTELMWQDSRVSAVYRRGPGWHNGAGWRHSIASSTRTSITKMERTANRGYSCSRDAANTLGVIGKMFATEGNPNTLTIKNQRYFFERGGEQRDGAITGTLYRMLPNEMCRKVGSTRINADGTIARFPVITAAERVEAVSTMLDLSASNPQLLHARTSGRL